jgi:chromosome partitioning protein
VSSQLEQHFGTKVYGTVIPRNVRLAEAPSYGTPAVKFDAECKGSQAYLELASELLGRTEPGPAPAPAIVGEEGA